MDPLESHKRLTSVISSAQLGSDFSEAELLEIESSLIESVITHANDVQKLALIAEMANTFIRFGFGPKMRTSGLDILSLLMESQGFKNSEALQLKLFAYFHRENAQALIAELFKSIFSGVRKKAILHFYEIKLHLTPDLKENEGFLIELFESSVDIPGLPVFEQFVYEKLPIDWKKLPKLRDRILNRLVELAEAKDPHAIKALHKRKII